ncbi:MAG: glutaredoxin [candidate division Kazan bacterium GW2011_GWA1_50_15]|uniref:Glutaredoxin-like protein n=2 Tax=Bacteria division Kazan-3B-28 TaxID=1798534 RepID=A0A0G2A4J9_UNCK3|nr:MAG: glutaredoxin [candidate division Kazan bacterium GW2011_GWA1_50_15]KKW25832.1 MAG: glutaredoxin-like protein [candidate division Kazan bacterium GW2011_GWC1_52_13]KKW27154.1 MAG: glutaredoxin-like protein [candidate division Kazan bacterium GW2011_GWB1_52_7]HCR42442.1 NrdH-redoxin [Patescibacteria group bacterium]
MSVKKYTIYSTPTCHYCHLLKDWLSQNRIAFDNKDVATDIAARQEMVQKSQQLGVPVSVVQFADNTERVIVGFDQLQLSRLLGL